MRINKVIETFAHKLAIYRLWKENSAEVSFFQVVNHDLVKMINILLVGDNFATKLHRGFCSHHQLKNPTDKQFKEAYLDWASARITKPEKPLNAIETARKWYPHLYKRAKQLYKEVGYK